MARSLPSLNALLAFEAAARHQSMAKAAHELHVTHGAISRQVRQLEQQLGLTLFEKDGRGVRLTADGEQLRESCSQAFDRLHSGIEQLQRHAADAPFVLACPGSLLARWFIPRLDQLQRDLPELNLQLSASEADLDPSNPRVDATLLFAEPPWPQGMQVFELQAERIGPVLSPLYQALDVTSQPSPEALLTIPLLHTASRPQAWPLWFAAQQPTDQPWQLGQGFEHLYFLLEAALAGLGVAIAPYLLVADDLRAGRLHAPWGFIETKAQLILCVRPSNAQRASVLARWLTRALSDLPTSGIHIEHPVSQQ